MCLATTRARSNGCFVSDESDLSARFGELNRAANEHPISTFSHSRSMLDGLCVFSVHWRLDFRKKGSTMFTFWLIKLTKDSHQTLII